MKYLCFGIFKIPSKYHKSKLKSNELKIPSKYRYFEKYYDMSTISKPHLCCASAIRWTLLSVKPLCYSYFMSQIIAKLSVFPIVKANFESECFLRG